MSDFIAHEYPAHAYRRACAILGDEDTPCVNTHLDLEDLPTSGTIFLGPRIVRSWAKALGMADAVLLADARDEIRELKVERDAYAERVAELEAALSVVESIPRKPAPVPAEVAE